MTIDCSLDRPLGSRIHDVLASTTCDAGRTVLATIVTQAAGGVGKRCV